MSFLIHRHYHLLRYANFMISAYGVVPPCTQPIVNTYCL